MQLVSGSRQLVATEEEVQLILWFMAAMLLSPVKVHMGDKCLFDPAVIHCAKSLFSEFQNSTYSY